MGAAILSALRAIFLKLFAAMLTKNLLEWLLFWTADLIVKSTKTKHDDVFLAKLKESYKEQDDK